MIKSRTVYGLDNARLQSRYSKDPSTQVGAAILRSGGTIASVGRNGFPRGIVDSEDRLTDRAVKMALTTHAEVNAIVFCREPLTQYHTLYVFPWAPCANCASVIVNSGLGRVITVNRALPERWQKSMDLARAIFEEAKVEYFEVDEDEYLAVSKIA